MKKLLEITKHVNLLDEAVFLLYLWINKGDIGDLKLYNPEDIQMDIDRHNKKCDIISQMFKEITDKFIGKKDRIEYYFKERNSQFSTLGALALLWEIHDGNNQLLLYEERIRNLNEGQKVKKYAYIINSEEAANTSSENLQTLTDLITFIEASPVEKDVKWEAIKIYNNQETYYNEVSTIITEVIEIMNDMYSKEIAILEQDFFDYWSSFQKDNDIIETIKDKLNIAWNSNNEIVVAPLIFLPYGVTISSYTDKESQDIMRISFLIDKNFTIGEHRISKEDVINVGKLFGDKSKVDILEFISKKSCYGKEIANELSLSTATISYHVNALLKVAFIKADLISNKVYYSIDKDRISTYLDDIKDYFNKL